MIIIIKKIKSYFFVKRYKEVITIKKELDEFYTIVIFDNNGTLEKKYFKKELQKN